MVAGYWIPGFYWGVAATLPLVTLGLWDVLQRRHNLLRNYPLVGHLRYLIEDTGAELRQYIVESNTEGKPFNRDQRSLMYQRAVVVPDKAERVPNFHHSTVRALAEVIAAAGLEDPGGLEPHHLYRFYEPGQLIEGRPGDEFQPFRDAARVDSFGA